MADSGKNAAFTFAALTYTTESCIQSWDLASSINDIVYQCNGYDKHASGTKAISFRSSLALPANTTVPVNLQPGTTGALSAYPGGNSAGNILITSTRGTIVSAPISAPINGIITLDLEIALDDVTYTTV